MTPTKPLFGVGDRVEVLGSRDFDASDYDVAAGRIGLVERVVVTRTGVDYLLTLDTDTLDVGRQPRGNIWRSELDLALKEQEST